MLKIDRNKVVVDSLDEGECRKTVKSEKKAGTAQHNSGWGGVVLEMDRT